MLKKNIEYVDFNGVEREEDFYFHLSTPELVKLEAKYGGDVVKHIVEVVDSQDFNGVVNLLEDLILSSIGEKTLDGKSFTKTPEIRRRFEQSQAYAELFQDMFENPEEFGEMFGQGIVAPTSPNEEHQQQVKALRDQTKK